MDYYAKIKPTLNKLSYVSVCQGTGSEVNPYARIFRPFRAI